jgi:hypothetical protein
LSALTLEYDHDITVFFLGETAGGYRNQLDFAARKDGQVVQERTKIFGDTSCNPSDTIANFSEYCANPNDPIAGRSKQDSPLNVGDWASIGRFTAGTVLDFLLVSNGANGGIFENGVQGIFGVDETKNPDQLQHVMAYYFNDLLILGYEYLWGGAIRITTILSLRSISVRRMLAKSLGSPNPLQFPNPLQLSG